MSRSEDSVLPGRHVHEIRHDHPALLDVEGAIDRLPMPASADKPAEENRQAVGASGALVPCENAEIAPYADSSGLAAGLRR